MLCGIEIHQRIAGKKLFCNCVSEAQPKKVKNFTRKLHAVRSELGEIDSAVRLEQARSREFYYDAPVESTCLVEADDEPPHNLNPEALDAVLMFCELFSSKTVDEVHIMRKNVIDGSNTSGFQRTAVVGIGGRLKTKASEHKIQAICIEEESAGIISGKQGIAHYDLARLGIPLVEIATAPTLKSGKQAQEAALAIGSLLRRTGKVQRGIGTIRQDINVSIPQGARVEIKGVQELSMVEKTVDLEIQRQKELAKIADQTKKILKGRKIGEKFFNLTNIFSGTKSKFMLKLLSSGQGVYGILLPGFSGLLGRQISPGKRFGSELADYACIVGVKGIIHSDEDLEKYGISDDEIAEIKVALSTSPKDAFVLIGAKQEKAHNALSEVAKRVSMLHVPEETRRANPDGTSSYMRPLPGKARMYPETDLPPVPITKQMLKQAISEAAKMLKNQQQKQTLLSSLNDELKAQLAATKGPELETFSIALKLGIEPKFAASTLTNTLNTLRREGENTKNLSQERLASAFSEFKKGTFAKSAMPEILRLMCKEAATSPAAAAKKLGLEKITGKELQMLIKKSKLDLKGLFSKYRMRIDAAEATNFFKKAKQ